MSETSTAAYERPEILDSIDALATMSDAEGIAVGGVGCGSRCLAGHEV